MLLMRSYVLTATYGEEQKNVCAACVQQKSVGVATLWLPRSRKPKGSNGSQGLVAFSHNRDAVRCLRLRPRSDDACQRVSDRMGK